MPNPISSLGFLHIMNDGFLASFPLLLPFIQKELGIGFGYVGFLSGLLGSAGVVLALPSSAIAVRYGGRRVLRFAIALYSMAFILTGASPNPALITLSFIVASVGFGLFHPIAFSVVARESGGKEIGKKMGGFTAIGDIGRVGIAALATILVAAVGWRSSAIVYGALPLSLLLFSTLFCRRPSAQGLKPDTTADKPHGLRYSLDFILAIVTGCIDALASSSLFIFIPFLLIHRGIPTALIGSLSGAFFIGNMLGKLVLGKVIDKFGCYRVFILAEIIMAGLLALLSVEKSTINIAVLSVFLGAVTRGTVPVINTIVTNSVPDRRLYEKAFGIVSFASGISGVAAPILFGIMAERFGIVSVFLLSACFAILAIVPVLVAIVSKHGISARNP